MAKRTAGNAVRKAAVTRFGRNVRMISRGFSHTLMRTRFINHTIGSLKTLNMLRQGIHTAIMNTRIMVKVTQFGKVAAQLAAKAGAALGWIAAVVIIVILILEIGQGLINSKVEDGGAVNHIYVQDTEIIQEVIDELSAKNEAFIIDINHAANHRGNYAVNSGFKADEGVSFYEDGAYHVIFRDFYGNELEPSHVDLNNTKAIISMATKFMPYPFTKLSDQVSEEEKKAYEEIKQHFKDYCNYLWASTHQISIEEYHPGDSNYSHVDASALITELSTGICGKDGERLWLPDDFYQRGKRQQLRPVPGSRNNRTLPFNDNLCSHGNDKTHTAVGSNWEYAFSTSTARMAMSTTTMTVPGLSIAKLGMSRTETISIPAMNGCMSAAGTWGLSYMSRSGIYPESRISDKPGTLIMEQ